MHLNNKITTICRQLKFLLSFADSNPIIKQVVICRYLAFYLLLLVT